MTSWDEPNADPIADLAAAAKRGYDNGLRTSADLGVIRDSRLTPVFDWAMYAERSRWSRLKGWLGIGG